jgi:hypothetical protein
MDMTIGVLTVGVCVAVIMVVSIRELKGG